MKTLFSFLERWDISSLYQIFWALPNTLNRCMKRPKKIEAVKWPTIFHNLPNKTQIILGFPFVQLMGSDFPLAILKFHLLCSRVGKIFTNYLIIWIGTYKYFKHCNKRIHVKWIVSFIVNLSTMPSLWMSLVRKLFMITLAKSHQAENSMNSIWIIIVSNFLGNRNKLALI